jgi:hypothetical protein
VLQAFGLDGKQIDKAKAAWKPLQAASEKAAKERAEARRAQREKAAKEKEAEKK